MTSYSAVVVDLEELTRGRVRGAGLARVQERELLNKGNKLFICPLVSMLGVLLARFVRILLASAQTLLWPLALNRKYSDRN